MKQSGIHVLLSINSFETLSFWQETIIKYFWFIAKTQYQNFAETFQLIS